MSPVGQRECSVLIFVFCCLFGEFTGDPVVRWDSYDTVTDSASCADDHHRDASSSAGLTQSK